MSTPLETAHARIADCLQLDGQGRLVQRRDHLNLAGLGLTDAELTARFVPEERGLPEISLASLPHLHYLDLTGNQLAELPDCVTGFKGLVWLGLNFNRLTHLDGLGRLTNLQRLYLRGNALTRLPDGAGNLRNLVELDLTGNAFSRPDGALLRLLEGRDDESFHLGFADNPGEFTLRAKDGTTAFREHLRELLKQGVEVREGKLLLVGEGRMGKSTLLQALLELPFVEDRQQTHGLKMKPLPLVTAGGDVRLNCWDFSGQKELRETHQIFFTEPAIYLVVWNAGQTVDAEDLRQWLWLIKHRTNGRGRALVVATNTYMNPRPLTGEQRLRDEFGGKDGILLAPEFFYVECNERCAGGQRKVEELKARLVAIIEGDESFCQRSLPAWKTAQDDLAEHAADEAKAPYMPWGGFAGFCSDRGIADGEVRRFARHQHEVGRLVWVDRGAMAENVILSPDWLSKALGYVVRARLEDDPAEKAGLMSEARIHAIWTNPQLQNEENKPEPAMPPAMFPAFRAFMEEFDMAHVTTQTDGVRRYLIPQRLLPNPPPRWAELREDFKTGRVLLHRRIDLKGYDGRRGLNKWLLRAFFFRLIVRFHPYLVGREDALKSANWEQGFCIAETYYGTARIFSQGHHLLIEAAGPAPERLWWRVQGAVAELCDQLKEATRTEIHSDSLVPCRADCPRPLTEQGYFPESEVLKAFASNVPTLGCKAQDCYEQLSVEALHRGVVQSARGAADGGKLDELLRQTAAIREELREALAATREERELAQTSRQTLETGLAQLATALRDIVTTLDDPSRAGPCLFLVVPRDPNFLKDRGRMFGQQFRLHLFCERLLKPVNYLEGTADCGAFDFEMTEEWWNKTAPYLKAVGRLLATLLPAAGLLGGEVASLAKPVADFEKLAESAQKLLEVEGPDAAPATTADGCGAHEIWTRMPGRGEGRSLTWLHDFLKKECKTDDLTTAAKLGLQRMKDKTSNRYLWVHHTQT